MIKIPLPLDSLHFFSDLFQKSSKAAATSLSPTWLLHISRIPLLCPTSPLHSTHMGLSVTPDVLGSHPPLMSLFHTLAFPSLLSLVKCLMHKGISPFLKRQEALGSCTKTPDLLHHVLLLLTPLQKSLVALGFSGCTAHESPTWLPDGSAYVLTVLSLTWKWFWTGTALNMLLFEWCDLKCITNDLVVHL